MSTGSVEAVACGYREILAPQEETSASLNALGWADAMCVAFGAHLSGLMFGLVPHYPLSLAGTASPDGWMHAQRQASEEAEQAERRLRDVYAKLGARNELKRVDAFEQEIGRICAARARTVDLTVLGWSGDDNERALFEACLFDSGRAVLLVPAGFAPRGLPQRVLVAWNGSREAARALREALPLLRQARLTRVVSIDSGDDENDEGDATCADVARHLASHNVALETKRAHSGGRDVATALVDEAEQFGASLIVLGGYGHVRAGRWLYGGATRAALERARIPLFFAH